MYDLDGNGSIDKEEMTQIMESFYKLVGPLVTFSGKKYDSPQQLVDEVNLYISTFSSILYGDPVLFCPVPPFLF